jgi:hypothetical protein
MLRTKYTCWSCGGVFVDVGKQPLACPRCGSQPGAIPEFPKTLLQGVAWSFASKQPKDCDALRAMIAKDYATIYKKPPPPDDVYAVAIPSCRVVLQSLYVESVVIEQTARFTAGELLVATHRALAPKLRKHERHLFEGFELRRAETDKPPVYAISLSS